MTAAVVRTTLLKAFGAYDYHEFFDELPPDEQISNLVTL